MPKEIERRFLIQDDDAWNKIKSDNNLTGIQIFQFYTQNMDKRIERIRVCGNKERKAYKTIKTDFDGYSCTEIETEIDIDYATKLFKQKMIDDFDGIISKIRYVIPHDGLKIEVDEFLAPSKIYNLIIAEIELPSVDHPVKIPEWFGKEVSGIREWNNSYLIKYGRPDIV